MEGVRILVYTKLQIQIQNFELRIRCLFVACCLLLVAFLTSHNNNKKGTRYVVMLLFVLILCFFIGGLTCLSYSIHFFIFIFIFSFLFVFVVFVFLCGKSGKIRSKKRPDLLELKKLDM